MDSIAKTSLLTAAMRAAESKRSEREGRLFVDPFAELLAGAEGAWLLRRALEESGEQPAIAVRTKFIDEKILGAVKDGMRQIVMLAAGMDTRAFRLSFPKETKIFELDRSEVLAYKQMKLAGYRPNCEQIFLGLDLREAWQNELVAKGFRPGERTLWLVEGLVMYLEESQVLELLGRINTLAIPKDMLLCDILSRTLLEAPYMEKQLGFLKSIGASWKFGVNEPEDFMRKVGWNAVATQPGEYAPTRWPFPTAPRHVPNVPRSFYVEAEKS